MTANGTGEFQEASTLVNGTNGQLLIQTRHQMAPQLTLSIHHPQPLAKLQSDVRDHAVASNKTSKSDILLSAIATIQQSGMVLNVNAFMAATYCIVQPAERKLILSALRWLLEVCEITSPVSELDAIFDVCRR